MSSRSPAALLRDVHTLFDAGTATGLSDRQLLDRFAGRRDASAELAFEVLIMRHGPMVLRVCRNLLRNADDAQDAFQATFLVLVKRRASIRRVESVGGWLYGVACRVAARARVERARRWKVEERAALRIVEAVEPAPEGESDLGELGPIVQEEVGRLPEKYRSVVVLCYWEGLTQELAAAHLGCPLGTVRSRLARARNLLERRLMRRGLVPLAGVVAAAIDGASAPASAGALALRLPPVAPELVRSTVQAASGVMAGNLTAQGVTAFSAFLVQRMLWSMTMFKISSIAAAVVILGVVGVGVGIAAQRAGTPPAAGQANGGQVAGDIHAGAPNQPQAATKGASGAGSQNKPSPPAKIYTRVVGQTTIVSIVPDGAVVKKGQVVCELDSSALRNQLVNVRLTAMVAASNYEQAKADLELAEIAVTEYIEGLYLQELQESEIQIKTAEAELAIAEDEREEARVALSKDGKLVKRWRIADLQFKKARFALELAQTRRKVLVDYTRPKRIKELKAAVEKKRSGEMVKKATWEQKASDQRTLEQQIAACTIDAPIDGTLVYAQPDSASGAYAGGMMMPLRMGSAQRPIQEGAIVGDHELLFEIVPTPESKPAGR